MRLIIVETVKMLFFRFYLSLFFGCDQKRKKNPRPKQKGNYKAIHRIVHILANNEQYKELRGLWAPLQVNDQHAKKAMINLPRAIGIEKYAKKKKINILKMQTQLFLIESHMWFSYVFISWNTFIQYVDDECMF